MENITLSERELENGRAVHAIERADATPRQSSKNYFVNTFLDWNDIRDCDSLNSH